MFSKKKLVGLVILGLMLPTLAACGPEAATPVPPTATTGAAVEATATTGEVAEATEAPAEATPTTGGGVMPSGGVFTWRAFGEPGALDPALMQEFLSIDIGQNLYDALVEFDPQTQEL
ncbi:MAG TPA: hypothetical protein VEX13_16500, partial [Chloroflexia bacterium]|nr:hypothetical protein [Chloroflexia bacterium]